MISIRQWISILWPAFLLACLMESLVFAFVDPTELRWGSEGLGYTRQAIYSTSFFVFWLVGCATSALTLAIATKPPADAPAGISTQAD
ncbi:hypothetical protein QTI66_37005 [Variovorax sp. J22R133]|uniref:hypothetical protein n=1 Tax=Variovorax brevis TaxID=3053503 RepID=UPI002578364C|nr:hypothetical protein [Variovorax sp. J22R133]MDM0117706.1 hypothetical protein [Variovorax sp. J22R133]